jgi:hypothetical protein
VAASSFFEEIVVGTAVLDSAKILGMEPEGLQVGFFRCIEATAQCGRKELFEMYL